MARVRRGTESKRIFKCLLKSPQTNSSEGGLRARGWINRCRQQRGGSTPEHGYTEFATGVVAVDMRVRP
jgi:hypothetical protein